VIATAFGISKSAVATHLRRIAKRHPELWAAIEDHRSRVNRARAF
jgi:DNA-binding CsgD family transcriptional regulator